MEERRAVEKERDDHRVTIQYTKPIAAISANEGKWQPLTMVADSGAAETVIPHTLVTDHPIHETQESRAGVCYESCDGTPIPNLGEQRLPLYTQEGTFRSMKFQAAHVSKPLGSVFRMCQAGHRVVSDADGSYIQNKLVG